ncbi:hypothetical protein T492DRAFT_169689 [Pavlovales sp. CCMP2436]|nr:hypothetical protein T492DRAFT_169689 [Pavlovales sp. CCMP2436]
MPLCSLPPPPHNSPKRAQARCARPPRNPLESDARQVRRPPRRPLPPPRPARRPRRSQGARERPRQGGPLGRRAVPQRTTRLLYGARGHARAAVHAGRVARARARDALPDGCLPASRLAGWCDSRMAVHQYRPIEIPISLVNPRALGIDCTVYLLRTSRRPLC